MTAAVALLTSRLPPRAPQVSRAALLAGLDASDVLAAMETVTGAMLDTLPGRGARLLQALGLLAATHDS